MAFNYDCLTSILEEAVDPCKSGALYTIALEFVDQQTGLHGRRPLQNP